MIFNAIMKKFSVISQIKELSEITAKDHTILLNNDFCSSIIPNSELYAIIHKFADDHKAIRVIKETNYGTAMSSAARYSLEFSIELLPNFNKLYEELFIEAKANRDLMREVKLDEKEQKSQILKKTLDEIKELKVAKVADGSFKDGCWISYSESSREIILNNLFLIAKPDFDSENEQVFNYLYKNPNKPVGRGEIMEDLKISLTKDFHKIVENLKFKKDLRKAFFDISQDSIKFFNPVSKERLQELGIKTIAIEIK